MTWVTLAQITPIQEIHPEFGSEPAKSAIAGALAVSAMLASLPAISDNEINVKRRPKYVS
jgi:hypothetical protein